MPINRFANVDAIDEAAEKIKLLRRRASRMRQSISDGLDTMDQGFDASAAALATETLARSAADTAEATARGNADTFMAAAMTNEQSIRANADTALANAITKEVNDRTAAITAEVTARNSAISTAISSEVTARNLAISSAVSGLASSISVSSALNSEVDARNAAIATVANAKTGKYAATFGNAVLSSFTFTHNLNTLDVIIQVYVVASGAIVTPSTISRTANSVTLGFLAAVGTNANRVVIIG